MSSHSLIPPSGHQKVFPLLSDLVQPSSSITSGSPTRVGGLCEGSLEEADQASGRRLKEVGGTVERQMTIDALPEDVIMRIFDFHVNDVPIYDRNDQHRMAKWRTLVHVCQRWRCLTFGSPRRLGLALEYTGKKPMEETMAVWPALPIAVIPPELVGTRATNIAEALDSNRERVSEIRLVDVPRSHWDRFVAVMESPFPRLTHLQFCDNRNSLSLSPVSPHFLGGSGPNLQRLELKNIAYPFSTIQKLLLTANNLVSLTLWHTPHAGYVSPESMVTCLSGMPRLDNLCLRFRPFGPYPSRPSPPPTRIIIPALTKISFKGPYEYLEDLVARIDIPRLRSLNINFFMDLMFDIPQLHHFISHTQQLRNLDHAELLFSDRSVSLQLIRRIPPSLSVVELALTISCRQSDWQLSSLARVCLSRLPPFSTLEHLMIVPDQSAPPQWKDDMESIQWLELLDPFPALKTLYLPEDVALRVGNALQDLAAERPMEALSALEILYISQLEGSPHLQEAIGSFVTRRRHSGHSVVVHHWRRVGWWKE